MQTLRFGGEAHNYIEWNPTLRADLIVKGDTWTNQSVEWAQDQREDITDDSIDLKVMQEL